MFVEPGTDLSSLAALPGKPAVLIAAERNDLAAVVALLAAGCPANKAFRGKTALDTARKHDNAAMVTALSAAT